MILAVNDHFWKDTYHNWLTGKISDLAGLIVLPVFIAFLFPKLTKWSCQISALFFIYWKTELSNGLIELLNQNGIFSFKRIIDFTDFIALMILPISWLLINPQYQKSTRTNTIGTSFLVLITFLTLTATSIRPIQTLEPEGTILVNKKHYLKVPKDTVLDRIERLGYTYELSDNFYRIKDIIVPEIARGRQFGIKQDTIKELTFSFIDFPYQPTKKQERLGAQYLYIHEVKFSDINTITDWRVMKKYSKLYGDISKELFAKESTKK